MLVRLGSFKRFVAMSSTATARSTLCSLAVWTVLSTSARRQWSEFSLPFGAALVALLPDRPDVRTRLQPVLGRIRGQGGSARMITVSISGDEHQALVDEQQRDRDTEYGEVVKRVPQFLAEIDMETARGRATYAEVEESEADLERFEKWLTAIANRDYFDAPGGDEARAAVQRCREALAAFETAALAADMRSNASPSPALS